MRTGKRMWPQMSTKHTREGTSASNFCEPRMDANGREGGRILSSLTGLDDYGAGEPPVKTGGYYRSSLAGLGEGWHRVRTHA